MTALQKSNNFKLTFSFDPSCTLMLNVLSIDSFVIFDRVNKLETIDCVFSLTEDGSVERALINLSKLNELVITHRQLNDLNQTIRSVEFICKLDSIEFDGSDASNGKITKAYVKFSYSELPKFTSYAIN